MIVESIRFRGVVQGVGFRPTVARVARRRGLDGWVRNDAEGVIVALAGPREQRDAFVAELLAQLPPLASVEAVERREGEGAAVGPGFAIVESAAGHPRTGVAADAATCAACRAEIRDPLGRRYRYPFTNCTHCGPRFTIVTGVPYDRARTTMAGFPPCPECRAEYEDEADRRYHAEPIACHACGPRARLSRADGRAFTWQSFSMLDEVDAVATLLQRGEIVAVQGLGGYHLCCDATNEDAVRRLRDRKRRPAKPFALMAKDLPMIERCCAIDAAEREALAGPEAPILLLDRRPDAGVAPSVAPGQRTLGFMLPSTPLHHLVLLRMAAPIVCTSGNLTDEPPCTDPAEARARLGAVADWFLDHDRPIAQRADDSVARLADGAVRLVRRARGYTPAALALPEGFAAAPRVLAMGAHLKSTVAIVEAGRAVLSPHLGDLDDALNFAAWQQSREALCALYEHTPEIVAVDAHPGYRSTIDGAAWAEARGLPVVRVLHHHAHVAAAMAEHGLPLGAPPVLGVALDGLGYGEGGALWGGEFLIATYTSCERVGTFKPVPLLGGDRAAREPWRNLYAHLMAEMSWAEIVTSFGELEVVRYLADKPRALLDQVLRVPEISPQASSCGRLFDAVAAAAGLHRDEVEFEGQAAVALEQAITKEALAEAASGEIYPFAIPKLGGKGLPYVEPLGVLRAVLGDLIEGADPALIAARFHVALAEVIARMVAKVLAARPEVDTVALAGGVFQNRALLELTAPRLRAMGYRTIIPRAVPANDGGIALGQAVIASARSITAEEPCASESPAASCR